MDSSSSCVRLRKYIFFISIVQGKIAKYFQLAIFMVYSVNMAWELWQAVKFKRRSQRPRKIEKRKNYLWACQKIWKSPTAPFDCKKCNKNLADSEAEGNSSIVQQLSHNQDFHRRVESLNTVLGTIFKSILISSFSLYDILCVCSYDNFGNNSCRLIKLK